MSSARQPKKTDTIEIRLADEVKSAFVEQCRREGRTVSETIRALIAQRLAPSEIIYKAPPTSWRTAMAAFVGLVLGVGIAVPSFARPACDSRQEFSQFDLNGDGVVTLREFQNR
ncbi:EF-hand domain-containing protein [Polymorphobacter sp.]|uniref:EF-hand domain-containing protein n=1 Tax=Polymorphobacter sp. TaxID=1909290 RepID=UPI003F6F6D27